MAQHQNTTESETHSNHVKTSKRSIEILGAIILSLTAFSAAWCGYQSTLWGSIQTFRLSGFTALNRQAQEKNLLLEQRRTIDANVTMNFINAYAEKEQEKMNFYLTRARSEIRQLFNSWMELDKSGSQDAPPHPLAMKEYDLIYKGERDSIQALRDKANDFYGEAVDANKYKDDYILLTVFFSAVLFLCGLSTQISTITAKKILIVIACLLYLFSMIVVIFKMPLTWGVH